MKTIKIKYLDDQHNILGVFVTADEYNAENIREWADTLNDSNIEHPDEPEGWTQFEIYKD